MRWLAPLAAVAFLAAGCGHSRHATRFGDLRVVETVRSTWHAARPPRSAGPAPELAGVTFLDARHGFAVSGAEPGIGIARIGFGRVQETRDGGTTWRTVWKGAHADLHWIGFSDRRDGFVEGWVARRGRARPLLLRSSDGGASWQALTPSLPRGAADAWGALTLQFPSARVGYAIADPDFSPPAQVGWMLRTVDGGRTWRRLRRPRGVDGAYAIDFLSARAGFAAGGTGRCSGLWRTDDAGASWRLLPASCGTVTAVDFLNGRRGLLAGGNPYFLESPPWQVVRATRDGGQTWRTLFVDRRRRNPGTHPIVKLVVTDPRHAFGATGGCKNGQNSPCAGDVLVTRDGGRRWRDTGQSAMAFAAIGTSAWAVPPCLDRCGVLWRTRDLGRTWTPLAAVGGPLLLGVEAVGGRLTISSDAGDYASRDGGRSWARLPVPPLVYAEPRVELPGLLVADGRVSRDGGLSWHELRLPARPWSLSFADPRHGFLAGDPSESGGLYATDDGGRSWRRLRAPFAADAVSAAPGLVAIESELSTGRTRIAFSRDGGRTWLLRSLPPRAICTVSAAPLTTAWLSCVRFLSLDRSKNVLFRSDDGGRTWTRLEAARSAPDHVSGPGKSAWAVGGGLWHSRDGGRTWRELWPSLPTPG